MTKPVTCLCNPSCACSELCALGQVTSSHEPHFPFCRVGATMPIWQGLEGTVW